jgi:hypothetical protein
MGASSRRRAGVRAWIASVATALLVALAALAMCEYRFGIGDQVQYLAQVVAIEEPQALAGDPYLRAFPPLRSVFWRVMATISDEESRPAACLAITIAIGAAAALVLIMTGGALARDGAAPVRGIDAVAGAAAAIVFVVPKEQNWFGIVALGDVELTATWAVVPLALGSMLAWTAGRSVLALALALAALPVHGQTAAYLLGAWVAAGLWTAVRAPREAAGRRPLRGRRLALLLAVLGAGLGAIALERRRNGVSAEHLGRLEEIGRGMYAELIDPWSVPWPAWSAVAAILALGAAAATSLARGSAGAAPAHARLRMWAVASLLLPAAGLVLLAAGAREPLLWRLMVGRSLMLPQVASLVLFAAWSTRAMRRGGIGAPLAAIALVLVAVWPFAQWPRPAAVIGLAAVIAIVAIDAGATARAAPLASARFATGAVAAALLLVAAIAGGRFATRSYPWLAPSGEPAWRAAQQWAREQTAPGSLFVTPPHLAGWRIGAHRPTYGELNDGGLLFYAGGEAIGWAGRMAELGVSPAASRSGSIGRAYAETLGAGGARWCAERGIDYVVTEAAHDVEIGTVVWSSREYVVRRVADADADTDADADADADTDADADADTDTDADPDTPPGRRGGYNQT